MRTILKYKVDSQIVGLVEMPMGAKINGAGVQTDNQIVMWADVEDSMPMEKRWFRAYKTGADLGSDKQKAVAIVFIKIQERPEPLVYHIYEIFKDAQDEMTN